MKLALLVGLGLLFVPAVAAQERPNILWITSEDNAAHWLGCYGNEQAKTPRLDRLAKEGVRFRYAYSNAPVCAVARSTILTGVYAVSQGTQHMRSRHAIPSNLRPYPRLLRKAGYYCTNNRKTDYNIRGNDKSYWDASGRNAHYRKRPEGKPFFAIFNLVLSHESSLFPQKVRNMRRRGVIPKTPRIDPADVELPACVPDLPEVRNDFAIYHDTMTALDARIGELLDELEREGLADDTIVFYYSDHGGPTPRGKRYLEDTGVRVPMIVHVPEKWKSLSPFASGSVVEEPVSFVDLAPTLLSLVGVEKPEHMQGRAFLGKDRVAPATDEYEFLFADRFDELFGMRRGLTNGRWKYVRRFTPYLPAAPYSYYQFSQPGWKSMQAAWKAGELRGYHDKLWERGHAIEELFDTESDPWEVENLAAKPEHRERLHRMRSKLTLKMVECVDTGIVPEPMFESIAGRHTIREAVRDEAFDYPGVLEIAGIATQLDEPDRAEHLLTALESKRAVVRYWGLQGFLISGRKMGEHVDRVAPLLEDESATNRITAAYVLYATKKDERAPEALVAELSRTKNSQALLLAMNTLTHLDLMQHVPLEWAEEARKNEDPKAAYVKRFAERVVRQRR